MAARNLLLLFGQVALHLDNLHSVKKGARNRVEAVGCGDKHHLAQVVINIQVVVVEGIVLLGVQHFEQGRLGVALVIAI